MLYHPKLPDILHHLAKVTGSDLPFPLFAQSRQSLKLLSFLCPKHHILQIVHESDAARTPFLKCSVLFQILHRTVAGCLKWEYRQWFPFDGSTLALMPAFGCGTFERLWYVLLRWKTQSTLVLYYTASVMACFKNRPPFSRTFSMTPSTMAFFVSWDPASYICHHSMTRFLR